MKQIIFPLATSKLPVSPLCLNMHVPNVKFCDMWFNCVWVGGRGDGGELLGVKSFEKGFYEISKTISTGEYISCLVRSLFHFNAVT